MSCKEHRTVDALGRDVHAHIFDRACRRAPETFAPTNIGTTDRASRDGPGGATRDIFRLPERVVSPLAQAQAAKVSNVRLLEQRHRACESNLVLAQRLHCEQKACTVNSLSSLDIMDGWAARREVAVAAGLTRGMPCKAPRLPRGVKHASRVKLAYRDAQCSSDSYAVMRYWCDWHGSCRGCYKYRSESGEKC
mmetsp:Transcript_14667/g.29408  ORF Transcript_14667/g.29408 Transcript_14667/m.29408 type:complete len:193 (+) Transcript_14667:258-836(+)